MSKFRFYGLVGAVLVALILLSKKTEPSGGNEQRIVREQSSDNIEKSDRLLVEASMKERLLSKRGGARNSELEGMPLEIADWNVSAEDREIFEQLSSELLGLEAARVLDKSHRYSEVKPTDEFRDAFEIPSDIETIEVLHVTTALRPPGTAELQEIYTKLDDGIAGSGASPADKSKILEFFEDRFSLKEERYKIVSTNAMKAGMGDEVTRNTIVILSDEFIADGDEGQKTIRFVGDFTVEETRANPESRVEKRYSHVADTDAGE